MAEVWPSILVAEVWPSILVALVRPSPFLWAPHVQVHLVASMGDQQVWWVLGEEDKLHTEAQQGPLEVKDTRAFLQSDHMPSLV